MIINKKVEKINKDIIERYKEVEPATIGHFRNFGFMSSALKPIFDEIKLVGTAVTLRIPSMDSTLCHKILEIADEGNIIVVDRCGDSEYACWGGGVTLAARQRHISGAIIDGAITDIIEIKKEKFPIYYRSVSALTTKLLGIDGEINTTIQCGGVVVNPGDLILGDANGVVVISPKDAEFILKKALKMQKDEEKLVEKIKEGEMLAHLSGADDLIKL
ncbi:4-carboxy-4-hydroxy-2-oxoadipate aldolase [subsurface metagenome]|nr:RraA family protein [Clostridia bacterium]